MGSEMMSSELAVAVKSAATGSEEVQAGSATTEDSALKTEGSAMPEAALKEEVASVDLEKSCLRCVR